MRALIFNSGTGHRLGELTADRPKAMVRLAGSETIFGRQVRILSSCGIREFVVTTGPFPEQLEAEAVRCAPKGCSFEFVPNPEYDSTNYIYSMHLAAPSLRERGDFLVLHGDLVFDKAYARELISLPDGSYGTVDPSALLPDKDFKARVEGGEVREVSVGIFDAGCVAFQPLYRLTEGALGTWLDAVAELVARGERGRYAEDAANGDAFASMHVQAHSCAGHLVAGVVTPDDLARVSSAARLADFAQQPVLEARGDVLEPVPGSPAGAARGACDLAGLLGALGAERPMVVTGSHFCGYAAKGWLDSSGLPYALFGGFTPNPTDEEAAAGAEAFLSSGCDSLVSVGGGSAIDTAKLVKARVVEGEGIPPHRLPHVAIPTTAGTGSESTHFAVCYVGGRKTSVAREWLLPDAAILDPTSLAGLPDYQRKCALLDALCQAIESHWSARSTEGSRAWSSCAIPAIVGCVDAYLAGDPAAAREVMLAANAAGRAINLTTTTAAHAMSYGLTSRFGIPHGHAVAMCMPHVWRHLLANAEGNLRERLSEVSLLVCGREGDPRSGAEAFETLVARMSLEMAVQGNETDLRVLLGCINSQRLANHPLPLTVRELESFFSAIVSL